MRITAIVTNLPRDPEINRAGLACWRHREASAAPPKPPQKFGGLRGSAQRPSVALGFGAGLKIVFCLLHSLKGLGLRGAGRV